MSQRPELGLDAHVREVVDALMRPVVGQLQALEARLSELESRPGEGSARCVSVREACERWGFSRSTWDRWLADRESGLREVVVQAGRRVLVPVVEFEGWLRSRGE